MDENSRDIILQALCNQSVTGLFAGKSGPVMLGIHGLGDMMNPSE